MDIAHVQAAGTASAGGSSGRAQERGGVEEGLPVPLEAGTPRETPQKRKRGRAHIPGTYRERRRGRNMRHMVGVGEDGLFCVLRKITGRIPGSSCHHDDT